MLEDLIFKEDGLKKPLKLKDFDYKLLPFVLQKNKRKTLFVFEDSLVDCYDNLSLFFGDSGVFFDTSCLEKDGGVDGFLGWSGETKDLFLKSLSSGFKNHQFITICRSLYDKKVFPLNKVLDEVVLTKNTYTAVNSEVVFVQLKKIFPCV